MGQYFIIANLDKREYIHPHDLKYGAKLIEISNDKTIKELISFLLKTKAKENNLYSGRWARNKIILVGDFEDYSLFRQIIWEFRNISKDVHSEFLNVSKTT